MDRIWLRCGNPHVELTLTSERLAGARRAPRALLQGLFIFIMFIEVYALWLRKRFRWAVGSELKNTLNFAYRRRQSYVAYHQH